jgi:hypothetical protein
MIRGLMMVAGLLVLSAWLTWAPECYAQTARATIRQELSGEAQSAWDAAVELYEAGDYDGALVQFKRAHELSGQPQILFDVGLCLKNLARYVQAIAAWEQELSSRQRLPRADIQALETAISTLRPFVSTLEVTAEPAGAVVTVDGVEVGRAPLVAPVAINVGQRVVRVTKAPDFLPMERTIEVVTGQPASLDVRLEPAVKTEQVSVLTPGAEGVTLFLDGRELGAAPFQGAVPIGGHTFAARAAGYKEALKSVQVTAGVPLRITLSLARLQTEGKLRVLAEPADARISIDGREGTGSWEGLLGAGGHQLVVTRPGYDEYRADVSLSAGQDRSLEVQLKKSQSWVWWTVSLAAVVGGGAIATGYLLRPTDTPAVTGTLRPGVFAF